MGKQLRHFFQRQSNDQQVHEKVLNITSHLGKSSKSQWASHLSSRNYAGEGVEKGDPHVLFVGM